MPTLVHSTVPVGSLAAQPQPTLRAGDGVLLRPWSLGDAQAVMDAYQDGEIQRWHVQRADSDSEVQERIAGWQGGWAAETGAHWAVVDSETDVLLARAALKGLKFADGTAGVAYWTVPAARGRASVRGQSKRWHRGPSTWPAFTVLISNTPWAIRRPAALPRRPASSWRACAAVPGCRRTAGTTCTSMRVCALRDDRKAMREPLTVAAVQPVWAGADVLANVREHAQAIEKADVRLVVFPEFSSPDMTLTRRRCLRTTIASGLWWTLAVSLARWRWSARRSATRTAAITSLLWP